EQSPCPDGPGPRPKRWPRCPPPGRHTTPEPYTPWLRPGRSSPASGTAGSVKLGQPVPDSNFVSELNSSAPPAAHLYTPSSWQSQYSPVNAGSVPAWRSTWY